MITIEPAESMQQYVQRKLKDSPVKLTQVAKATGLNLGTIYNIRNGNDAWCSKVQKLHDYFRKLAD